MTLSLDKYHCSLCNALTYKRYTFSLDKKILKKVQKQNKKNNYKVCNNFLMID